MTNMIQSLEKEIRFHNKLYFIDNKPQISDGEFDELVEKLRNLDPRSPALFELVGEIGNVTHETPMLSIEKKYSYEDIQKWLITTGDKKYIVEPKYDGMAAKYQNGILSTRGNGLVGEDITARLKDLNVIGKLPKGNQAILGEIIIPLSYFNKYLSHEYKNPRNAVVGIIKSKKINETGIKALIDKSIHFIIYDEANSKKVSTESLLDKDEWEGILEETLQVDYPLDGIVIKAVSFDVQNRLKATEHHEKWQIAYKLPAERKWSKVIEIKNQVGRTGRVTSVAIINPVNLSGATVTNVTLHNIEFVKSSDIGIGSRVEVCRSGEVIPFITKVEKLIDEWAGSQRHSEDYLETAGFPPRYVVPSHCPICKIKLIQTGKYLECPNSNCPARTSQSIEYFFKTLGVEELGLKTIEKFMNIFDLSSPIDFYNLNERQICLLDGFGAKSAKTVVKNIQNTLNKKITQHQLLQALGIKEIGPATSKWIIKHFGFKNLPKLKKEDLENIKGIGPNKAEHFINDIKTKWPIAEALRKKGLRFKLPTSSNKLKGLTFCITGKKQKYSREEIIEIIEQNGGEYAASLTKNINYLITGNNAGSKLQRASTLGVKVITEGEFVKMIG